MSPLMKVQLQHGDSKTILDHLRRLLKMMVLNLELLLASVLLQQRPLTLYQAGSPSGFNDARGSLQSLRLVSEVVQVPVT